MNKYKNPLIIVWSIFGIVNTIDIILSEFFNIGVINNGNLIIMYIVVYFLQTETKDFPDILSNKFVKYPMYASIILLLLSRFSII